MSKGSAKTILLALAGVTVVAVSIYLSRSSTRGWPGVAESVDAPDAVDGVVGEGGRDPGRPVVGTVRSAVRSARGRLVRVQKRLSNEKGLVAASIKAGPSGRHLAEPIGQEPAQN